MPHLDGLAATRTILADPACTSTRVLVLTTFDDDDLVLEALRSGASGFLLKETRPDQLLEAIEVVAAGEALLHPRVTRRLIERFAALPAGRDPAHDDGLTDRERAVLRAVSQGLSNRDRHAAAPRLRHREDPRQPPADQAGLPRPGPAGHVRLRVRTRGPRSSLRPGGSVSRPCGRGRQAGAAADHLQPGRGSGHSAPRRGLQRRADRPRPDGGRGDLDVHHVRARHPPRALAQPRQGGAAQLGMGLRPAHPPVRRGLGRWPSASGRWKQPVDRRSRRRAAHHRWPSPRPASTTRRESGSRSEAGPLTLGRRPVGRRPFVLPLDSYATAPAAPGPSMRRLQDDRVRLRWVLRPAPAPSAARCAATAAPAG